tara:strand:- start:1336 stop:1512 length:177 start_codon:yes stop_codon:yes gene_type:complete
MRNKDLAFRKLEKVEFGLINLKRLVKTQEPVRTYVNQIDHLVAAIEEVKSMVEKEPIE